MPILNQTSAFLQLSAKRHLLKILVEERVTKASSGICNQGFDRAPQFVRRILELVDAIHGGEISFDSSNYSPVRFKCHGGVVDLWLVGRDDQVISLVYRELSELEANAAGSTSDDGEGS